LNYAALLVISGLVVAAALLWIALAAKMVADDEEAKAQAEAERRSRAMDKDVAGRERAQISGLGGRQDGPAEAPASSGGGGSPS
jgi:hypothetical protein